jgi:hypothetical protein
MPIGNHEPDTLLSAEARLVSSGTNAEYGLMETTPWRPAWADASRRAMSTNRVASVGVMSAYAKNTVLCQRKELFQ